MGNNIRVCSSFPILCIWKRGSSKNSPGISPDVRFINDTVRPLEWVRPIQLPIRTFQTRQFFVIHLASPVVTSRMWSPRGINYTFFCKICPNNKKRRREKRAWFLQKSIEEERWRMTHYNNDDELGLGEMGCVLWGIEEKRRFIMIMTDEKFFDDDHLKTELTAFEHSSVESAFALRHVTSTRRVLFSFSLQIT